MSDRSVVLLRAAFDILMKCQRSGYVLSALEQTAFYDDAECDGLCLLQDIADELSIEDEEL